MADANLDRNLLVGVLALQDDLIDAAQFADLCSGWALRREKTLVELLLERGWISSQDRLDIERRLKRRIARHGGDVHVPEQRRDRYTLAKIHAEVGLGRVWLARDTGLNREVALTEIKRDRSGHPVLDLPNRRTLILTTPAHAAHSGHQPRSISATRSPQRQHDGHRSRDDHETPSPYS